ncbi:MAG: alpha-L-rhamnosidase [Ruminococcaceae bacterium]|nr:alpha-L-rhamnosidase [Oscillospiraceae bacterium]
MVKVNDKFSALNGTLTDPRTRRYLVPKKIVLTKGDVTNTETLLQEKTNQITLDPGHGCVLKNHPFKPHAAILVDFGIEFPGSMRLMVWNVKGKHGRANILVRFGESVSEAMTPIRKNNTTNDHAIRDRIINVGFLSSTETNESGYRFAYIELLEPNGIVEFKAIQGVFTYLDLEYKGSFKCNDEKINRIWDTAAYTAHVNMQEYLWDGIKRDRLVWIGDMHTEVRSILATFGNHDVIRRSLDLVRDETPVGKWMNGMSSYSIWWLLIHNDLYRTTGDIAYLTEQKEYLTGLLDILADCVDENGVEHMPPDRFIDWPNRYNDPAVHAGLQGLLKMALDDGAELLEILGENTVADKCAAAAKRMYNHVPDCNGSKQAASLLILSEIGDAQKLNDEVITPGGAENYSTFFGYYLLAAKALAGDLTGALRDMKEYWGGMLDMGATTFWEDFHTSWLENAAPIDQPVPKGKIDIHGAYGDFCYKNFRHSLCHGWASGPCPFLTFYVLGIKCLAHNIYRITPDLGDLEWAEGTYPTSHGIIKVSARKVNGETVVDIDAPDEIVVLTE